MAKNIKINLMPKEYAPPRKASALEWGLAAAAAVMLVGAGVYYMGVQADTTQMVALAGKREQQLHVAKAQFAEATGIGQREKRVDLAEGELRQLVGRKWSSVLLSLRDLTPQDVTWQKLSVDGDVITLAATSRGLIDVAQLFSGVLANQQVAEVALRHVNEAGIKLEYKAEQGKDAPAGEICACATGEFKQLEFELVITLVRQEGGVPNGA